MRLWPARLAYLLGVGLLGAIYHLVPPARAVASVAIGVMAIAAIGLGTTAYRPPRRGAWAMLAVTVVLTTAANVTYVIAADRGPLPAYPALFDVLAVVQYLPAAIALLWLGQPQQPSRDYGMLLDIVNLSLAGSLVLWVTVVRAAVDLPRLSTGSRLLTIAAWVGFVATLSALVRILVDWHRNKAMLLVGAGVLTFLVADVIYLVNLFYGTRADSAADIGYVLSNALLGLAALLPSMALVASNRSVRPRVGPIRIAGLAVVLLAGPTLLLIQANTGGPTSAVAIGTVMVVIAAVTVVRVAMLAIAQRERARRERASRTAARALLKATTEADVVNAVDAAMRAMLAGRARHRVELVSAEPAPVLTRIDPHSTSRRALGTLRMPLAVRGGSISITRTRRPPPPARALQFTAPIADLVDFYPTLQGIADQAGLALDRIELGNRLRAEERERHFRTLVQTSRDVTLISRHGRVEYATPSAMDMFGRDVQGALVSDLLSAERPEGWSSVHVTTDAEGEEQYVRRPDGSVLTVLRRERDLTDDPTVNGIVITLRDVTAERNLQRDLAHRASHDPLTGLANAEVLSEAIRKDDARAALYIDLDDFKDINDTYGHEIGDEILRTTARRIESCLRSGDLAARIGGDEFAVLLRSVPDRAAAESIAQRLADALSHPTDVDGQQLTCRASIGLAYAEADADAQTLLRNADAALYTAKSYGKGRWSQYRPGMSIPTRKRVDARQRIIAAMAANTLRLHYQPIVEIATGVSVGFEALLLTLDGEDPMTPQEVVKAAEDTGIIADLGEWILATALRDAHRLDGGRGRYVSVNVSPEQVRDRSFVDIVRRQLHRSGVEPRGLVLELTEHAYVELPQDVSWDYLAEVRQTGTRIAIDDFGTGFANLAYLQQPGIDIIKLDGSFIADVSSARGNAVLRHTNALCQELGLTMIAEGVAEPAARDVLLRIGCRYGQGFLYAPGLPVEEATTWSPPPWLADD